MENLELDVFLSKIYQEYDLNLMGIDENDRVDIYQNYIDVYSLLDNPFSQ